jgi:hypothetical protein
MRSMLLTDLNRALVREGYAPLAALSDLYRDDTTTADADPMDDHPAGRGGGVRPRRGGRHERRPSTPRTGRLSGTSL